MIQNIKFSVFKRMLYFKGIAEQNDNCDISLDNQCFELVSKIVLPILTHFFYKNSPIDKAKVYHTGRIQLTYEYNINISSIV